MLVHKGGGPIRQLTNEPEGITSATLSGNGKVAFATTVHSRLLRIEIASGEIQEWIPATPSSNAFQTTYLLLNQPQFTQALTAGSAVCINGENFSERTIIPASPLPNSLGALEVLINGQPVPIISLTP